MIPRPKPQRFRLRRTMLFMNAQKPGLIKDAYIYGVDSIILDLEDAVAENQKDAARFSLYHALKSVDYGDTEVLVRMNGLETPHWQEDIRVSVAAGADGAISGSATVKIVEAHAPALLAAPSGSPERSAELKAMTTGLREFVAPMRAATPRPAERE